MAENHLQLADVIIASLRPQSMNSIPVSVHPVGHELIAAQTEREANEVFADEIEVDESYFGGHRKGNRGRGAADQNYSGRVRNDTHPDYREDKLLLIGSSILCAGYVSDFKHYRINHCKLFADRQSHINGIENFWNQIERHLRKFNDVSKDNFGLFLKECEWRFNTPSPKQQLTQLKQLVNQFLN